MTAPLKHSELRIEEGSSKLLETSASMDRWPMLRAAFERFAIDCSQGLRRITSTPTYFSTEGLSVAPLDNILEGWGDKILVAVFSVSEWDQQFLVGLDRAFIHSFLEALLGSELVNPESGLKAMTPLTTKIAGLMFEQVGQSLKMVFAEISPLTIKYERIEARLDLVGAGHRSQPMLVADVGFQVQDVGGHIFIALPQAVLLPLKSVLARRTSEVPAIDPHWRDQIEREVQRTQVAVQAVVERYNMTLAEIARFEVGTVMLLPAMTNLHVKLLSQGQALFVCELGQIDGGYTVKIEESIDERAEFINMLIAGQDLHISTPAHSMETQMNKTDSLLDHESLNGTATRSTDSTPNIDGVMRIPVSVQVILGSAVMPVANLLRLGRGAVIPLDHRVGEPVDVVVNGRVIARGEVVVVEDDTARFGVALTEVIGSAAESHAV